MNLTGDSLAKIKVMIEADVNQLRKEINDTKNKIDRDAEKIGKSFGQKFSKALTYGGALLAFKKAIDFSKQFKDAARDAEETRNKFNEVFKSLGTLANNTAKQFAKSFGLAESTAQDLLSSTGDLLVGFGFAESAALDLSVRVNSLAQDLASFQNFAGGAKGASEALTKALLGETESAKSLGIVIRQNTEEFRQQVQEIQRLQGLTEQQAKAVVILEEAYKQSTKAVGDYGRTRESLANVERRLDEEYKSLTEQIGQGLVPAFNLLTQAALGWLTVAKELLGINQEFSQWNLEKATAYYNSIENFSKEQLKNEEAMLKKSLEISSAKMSKLAIDSKAYETEKKYNDLLLEQFRLVNDLRTGNLDTSIFNASGAGKSTEGLKANVKILENQLKIYEELYPATEKWYNKSIELIKAQTTELIENGIAKEDALKFEKKIIDEVTKSYERMKIAIDRIPTNPLPKKSTTLGGVTQPTRPGFSNEGTEAGDLTELYENAANAAKFTFADGVVTAMDVAYGATNGFFEDLYIKAEWANSMLEKAFVGMANAFIAQVERMIAEWLAFQAIRGAFSLFGIPLPGAHSGGEFVGTPNGVMKMSSGGSFIVPKGFPNDSYPMMVESGERVSVTPASQVLNNDRLLNQVVGRLDILNLHMIDMQTSIKKQKIDGNINVTGVFDGRDIYLQSKKSGRVYNRTS